MENWLKKESKHIPLQQGDRCFFTEDLVIMVGVLKISPACSSLLVVSRSSLLDLRTWKGGDPSVLIELAIRLTGQNEKDSVWLPNNVKFLKVG